MFLSSGSEAVELALKMARAASGRTAVVVTERGYYGATMHALALSEAGRTMTHLPALEAVHRLPAPHCGRCPMGRSWPCDGTFPCLDGLAALANQPDSGVAAVLYEPVMAGGTFVPPLGYGARLRELTSRCGALLIAEEVTTGMGRTGRWFGFEHERIVPDILVIGKAIGGGLPVSVVVTSDVFESSCRDRLGRHVQSHQNDPFLTAGERILVMAEEFPSNVLPWRRTAQESGARLVTVAAPEDGNWTQAILDRIDRGVRVVAVSPCHWTNGSYTLSSGCSSSRAWPACCYGRKTRWGSGSCGTGRAWRTPGSSIGRAFT